jgi:hypothetical protein
MNYHGRYPRRADMRLPVVVTALVIATLLSVAWMVAP